MVGGENVEKRHLEQLIACIAVGYKGHLEKGNENDRCYIPLISALQI